jgi:GTP cyclohydrolase II
MDNTTINELAVLYEKIHSEFPCVIAKKENLAFTLYDFPNSNFKLTVTNRIHLQCFRTDYFSYFKTKTSKALEVQFPSIRFYWKGSEVFVYLEEGSSKTYVTTNGIEGFSARFYDIILFLNKEILELSWQ